MVACLSVNGAGHEVVGGNTMRSARSRLADGSAAFSEAHSASIRDLTKAGMGVRTLHGVYMIDDGVVKSIDMEAPGSSGVSSAEPVCSSSAK